MVADHVFKAGLVVVVVCCRFGCCCCCCCCSVVVWVKNDYRWTNTKMNKTPYFVVCFAQLWFEVFVFFQQPKAIKNKNNFLLFQKGSFLQKEAFGFMLLFFLCFCFFLFCSNLWSHFEMRFGVHKTARPLFKLVFEGLKFWRKLCRNF